MVLQLSINCHLYGLIDIYHYYICLDAFTSYVVVVRSSATRTVVILLVHSNGFACVWSPALQVIRMEQNIPNTSAIYIMVAHHVQGVAR